MQLRFCELTGRLQTGLNFRGQFGNTPLLVVGESRGVNKVNNHFVNFPSRKSKRLRPRCVGIGQNHLSSYCREEEEPLLAMVQAEVLKPLCLVNCFGRHFLVAELFGLHCVTIYT